MSGHHDKVNVHFGRVFDDFFEGYTNRERGYRDCVFVSEASNDILEFADRSPFRSQIGERQMMGSEYQAEVSLRP